MESLVTSIKSVGQEQVLTFYDSLPESEREKLMNDIREIDWHGLRRAYEDYVVPATDGGSKLKPTAKIDDRLINELPDECIEGTTRCSELKLNEYRSIGSNYMMQGKIAALLLAGGQGTRLGVNYPKGMFDVGLPSHKSLFELQANRISDLRRSLGPEAKIVWYVMTSEATMSTTSKYFEDHNYFGLDRNDVVFFEQGTVPCMDFNGKVLLDEKHKIARSPNGNGGLYEALHEKGIIKDMITRGIEFVHVYCVDNILVRICDPAFMGYCITKQVDVGAKVVEKVHPNEAVGIICRVDNIFKVIEYSEVSDAIAQKRDSSTGKLVFNSGNICEHFFRVDFLRTLADRALRYHLAIKKIPHVCLDTGKRVVPTEPNGIKLEKFIFDVFELTNKFAVWEVVREDEFSPVKNADGTEKDNPTTARMALLRSYELGLLST